MSVWLLYRTLHNNLYHFLLPLSPTANYTVLETSATDMFENAVTNPVQQCRIPLKFVDKYQYIFRLLEIMQHYQLNGFMTRMLRQPPAT